MYDFKKIEENVLDFWRKNRIYEKVKKKNNKGKKFYFLDGPPYTSGKVHIGTAWNKSLKDSVLRYKRAKGFDVWDRAGYDMHGLPTENATLKKLGLKNNDDVVSFGISRFIEECKKLCLENMNSMNGDFKRLGVWMDFDNAYQSITKEFIEGEWWLIKKAHEKGRLYEGLRTMTWCPITESALAKHELEYKNITDNSIYVKLKLEDKNDHYLIIWTTTPWTLAFNLAVMVNPDITYVKAKVDNEFWYVAADLTQPFIKGIANKEFKIIEKIKGKSLEGFGYIPPFYNELKKFYDEIKSNSQKTHTVILSKDYVDTSAGTGLVHCAPGCGPEDYEVGYKNNIPPFNNIDTKGMFPKGMGKFSGLFARKDDDKFIDELKNLGVLIEVVKYQHDYPHDWRHNQPVIFRTTKQWFFKIEDLKDSMIKANQKIKWTPNAAFNAFDSWLKNLRDNSISKQRYWGTPIPIWKNVEDESDYFLISSANELENLSKTKINDLHISSIDKIEIKKDGKIYRRIPDILDVWVDAGTVSWNCLDYPSNEKNFKELFPADFILEGKDQIRGWFNLLMVASMIAFDKPSFKNVYMHGFVNDSLGRKMSKSLGNYILPQEVVDKYGADSFRYYCIGGTSPGLDLNYNFEDMKLKNKNLTVLWNVNNYLIDLIKSLDINPKNLKIKSIDLSIEERYILSKLNSTIKRATELFEEYKINEVPGVIEELYLELSRTYIQLIRDKSSIGTEREKKLVVYTIYKVLIESLKLLAPITPFITEEIYQNLKRELKLKEESIHLFDWPKEDKKMINKKLEENIQISKEIISEALAHRERIGYGVRWPLNVMEIYTSDESVIKSIKQIEPLIIRQINIKKIKLMKENAGTKFKIILDDKITPELEQEGFARELTRRIQNLRKKAGLKKQDKIKLNLVSDYDLGEFIKEIKEKVGAKEITNKQTKEALKENIKGKEFLISLSKI